MNTINIAVVGEGFIGKKHCFFIEQHPYATLSATIDPKSGSANYASIDAFIAADHHRTDIVSITSPNGLHVEHAIQLIKAGYHVIIEKPLAIDSDSALALKAVADRSDRKVFVVMQNRYSPVSQWLKTLVDEDLLGKIYMLQINCFWNRDERYYKAGSWHGTKVMDGGSIYTQFSHFIDLIYWCFGDIQNIRSAFYDFNHQNSTEFEDSGIVQFSLKDGGAGQFNFSTSCHGKNLESAITILAEKGTVKVGGQYMDQVLHCDIEGYDFKPLPASSEVFGKYQGNAANHRFVIDNVVRTLNGQAQEDTRLEEGLAVVRMIERMYAADQ